jgi:hypothetical protein
MKTKYWLTTADGAYAQVEGVEERDRLTPLGWTVVDEPTDPAAFVWMCHDGIENPAKFPVGSVPNWEAQGWKLCGPPKHVDPTKDPAAVDQPGPAVLPASAPKSTPASPAAEKNTKE